MKPEMIYLILGMVVTQLQAPALVVLSLSLADRNTLAETATRCGIVGPAPFPPYC